MVVRRLFLLGFAAALLTAFGCSSSGGSGGTPSPVLSCSDGGAAAATVAMSCGGTADGVTEQVKVVMGGPASGTTSLRGLNFDVTYAMANVQFVPAGSYTSPLFPNALIAVGLADGLPGRLVVSIQLPGSATVAVGSGRHDVLTLTFGRVPGTTFPPTALAFDNSNSEPTPPTAPVTFSTTPLTLAYQ
jgi:hypothetical protein